MSIIWNVPKKQYRCVRKMNSKITGAFNEGITGAVTTKTLVTEEDNLEEFSHLTREMRDGSVRASVINAIYYPIIVALGSVGVFVIYAAVDFLFSLFPWKEIPRDDYPAIKRRYSRISVFLKIIKYPTSIIFATIIAANLLYPH